MLTMGPMSPATTMRCRRIFLRIHADLGDFREVTRMTEMERQAHSMAFRKLTAPSGLFGHELDHLGGTPGVEATVSTRGAPITSSRKSRWSRPAAADSSCRKLWITQATEQERGARHGPEGVLKGSMLCVSW